MQIYMQNQLSQIMFNLNSSQYENVLTYKHFQISLNNKQVQVDVLFENVMQHGSQEKVQKILINKKPIDQIETNALQCETTSEETEKVKDSKNPRLTKKSKHKIEDSKRNIRKKDQNLCKKYNTIALKTINKIQTTFVCNMFRQKIYRQDFLIIVLKIADAYEVLQEFKNKYIYEVTKIKDQLEQQKPKNRKKARKNSDLIKGIDNSIFTVKAYSQENEELARLNLFNEKLRNKKFLQESRAFIQQAYSIIQKNLNESKN